MELLDGKSLSLERRENLKSQVADYLSREGEAPCLAVVLVGEDPASQVYVSHKIKACASVGLQSLERRLPGDVSQETLLDVVEELNQDPTVNGILVQLPLPKGLDESQVLDRISPLKDADGLTTENMGLLLKGHLRVAPCTPFGVIQMLKKHKVPMAGRRAVVVGRSQIVGKPMALLLMQEDATVTLCHSKTQNLREHLQEADIAVIAAGRPEFLGADDFSEKTVVVDVGIHRRAEGGLCGDVRFDEVKEKVAGLSPVPGGVGPMTIAMLLENTLKLAHLQKESQL